MKEASDRWKSLAAEAACWLCWWCWWCWWRDVWQRRKRAGERRCQTGSSAVRRIPSTSWRPRPDLEVQVARVDVKIPSREATEQFDWWWWRETSTPVLNFRLISVWVGCRQSSSGRHAGFGEADPKKTPTSLPCSSQLPVCLTWFYQEKKNPIKFGMWNQFWLVLGKDVVLLLRSVCCSCSALTQTTHRCPCMRPDARRYFVRINGGKM